MTIGSSFAGKEFEGIDDPFIGFLKNVSTYDQGKLQTPVVT